MRRGDVGPFGVVTLLLVLLRPGGRAAALLSRRPGAGGRGRRAAGVPAGAARCCARAASRRPAPTASGSAVRPACRGVRPSRRCPARCSSPRRGRRAGRARPSGVVLAVRRRLRLDRRHRAAYFGGPFGDSFGGRTGWPSGRRSARRPARRRGRGTARPPLRPPVRRRHRRRLRRLRRTRLHDPARRPRRTPPLTRCEFLRAEVRVLACRGVTSCDRVRPPGRRSHERGLGHREHLAPARVRRPRPRRRPRPGRDQREADALAQRRRERAGGDLARRYVGGEQHPHAGPRDAPAGGDQPAQQPRRALLLLGEQHVAPQNASFFQPTAQPRRAWMGVTSRLMSWPCSG